MASMDSGDTIGIDVATSRLHKFQSSFYSYNGTSGTLLSQLRPSAVLVPIFLRDDHLHVFLTKRSSKLRSHAGEVALPGGMKDDIDSDEVDTALREANEEVGLDSSLVKIIGRLPPRVTRNKVVIYPVVGQIPANFRATPNPSEVDSVFTLPLSRFLLDRDHEAGLFPMGKGQTGMFHIFTDSVNGRKYRTWGLTANILVELAVAVLQKEPEFTFDANVTITKEDPFGVQHYFLESFYDFPNSRL